MLGTVARARDLGGRTLRATLLGCVALAAAAAPAGASPARASCAVSPATIRTLLGLVVARPHVQSFGPAVACLYFHGATTANAVIVRVQGGESADSFRTARTALDAQGQATKALTGLGGPAFTSVIGFGGSVISATVAVLRGRTELVITAPAPLAKVEALARRILSTLGRPPSA